MKTDRADKKLVDLHIHTNCSDGSWSKEQLLNHLKSKNIKLFSITDHDNTDNSLSMMNMIDGNDDIKFIPGVEVNCTYKGMPHHLTTYNYDHKNHEFNKLLEHNRSKWLEYNDAILKKLAEKNNRISCAKYIEYVHPSHKGGWKLINFLFDEGIVKSASEYFSLIKDFAPPLVFHDPEYVIQILKKTNGDIYLAHPNAYARNKILPEDELEKWISFGICGIECYSSYCTLEESGFYVKFCNKYNLNISGGSDCHGDFLERKIGVPAITYDMIRMNR